MYKLDCLDFESSRAKDWKAQDIMQDIDDALEDNEEVVLLEFKPAMSGKEEHFDIIFTGKLEDLMKFKEDNHIDSDPYEEE